MLRPTMRCTTKAGNTKPLWPFGTSNEGGEEIERKRELAIESYTDGANTASKTQPISDPGPVQASVKHLQTTERPQQPGPRPVHPDRSFAPRWGVGLVF